MNFLFSLFLLTLTFALVSTWWDSDGVGKRGEFVIVMLGGVVRKGLLSGSATAFGGWARTDLEGSSGKTCRAWAGVRRASWVRSGGRWQIDFETVTGEAALCQASLRAL